MDKIIQGIRRFHDDVFPAKREWYEHLAAKQQKPEALFITCADSRIDPNLITQTEPGDLFILRIAGNVVPPYGAAKGGGEEATIEYAVTALGVKNIIICGHTHCGAMKALMTGGNLDALPAVKTWFSYAESTRQIMQYKYADVSDAKEREILAIQENVLAQLDNICTHPSVAVGLARNQLQLYGWVYSIETGDILSYDAVEGRYKSICEIEPASICTPPHLLTGGNGDNRKNLLSLAPSK